jgi:hypothetical protein
MVDQIITGVSLIYSDESIILAEGRCLVRRVCGNGISFEFTLVLTNVRSLPEDGITDRMRAI